MEAAIPGTLRPALGAHADRYEARFARIAATGRRWVPGWNSAAFLHSTAWFFYRRMYGLAILNFVAPWVLLVALLIVDGWFSFLDGHLDTATLIVFAAYFGAVFVLVPLFADSIYYRHLLERLPKARPPSAWTALGATVLVLPSFGLFLALALATHADYTLRSQVSEAVLASYAMRDEITAFYQQQRRLPNAAEAPRLAGAPSSKRVQSISYHPENHIIVVTMRDPFPGKRFTLKAIENAGQLYWNCRRIDLDRKYLPESCGPYNEGTTGPM